MNNKLIAAVVIVLIAGFVYWQFQHYRSPVSIEEIQKLTSTTASKGGEIKHSIPLEQIRSGGPGKDGIPSIDDPQFESVTTADQYLDDNGFGLDVEVKGRHRFYPYQILVWHEIVNETFNNKPLLVTYCPLCFTGIVFEREIDDESVEFGVSGKLYNNNLLMYDRKTDTLWSQAIGEAVVGELTGEELALYPSLTITWDDFKKNYPNGQVLNRETGASRDYTRDPYGNYYTSNSILFGLSDKDDRFHPKTLVYGIDAGTKQKAYLEEAIKEVGIINDTVGEGALVVFADSKLNAIRAFNRKVGDQELTFELDGEVLVDKETQTRWSLEGEAFLGELLGKRLSVIPLENHFWFSWYASHPQTAVFTNE